MKIVIQRVTWAEVKSEGENLGKIKRGLVVFVGVARGDTSEDVEYLARKVVGLRVFEDEAGKMNLSLSDIDGQVLIVSQFTLYGDVSRGRRPDFTRAATPGVAEELYLDFIEKVKSYGVGVKTGKFGDRMEVSICNDGPVTLILESKK